jgi:hypothetical protein
MCCGKSNVPAAGAPPAPTAIVSTAADVRALISDLGLFTLRRRKITVRIPGLATERQKQLELEIARHYAVCGCEQGRVTGVLTLLAYVILLATGVIPFRELGLGRTIGYYFLCSFITMLGGKIYGLWQARHSLAQLAGRLPQSPTPDPL